MMQRVTQSAMLALILVLAVLSPGYAQQKVTPVTTLISTATTGDSAELGVEFYSSVSFTVTMSSTGTVQFKVSGNGTSYSDLSCFSSDDTSGTPVTSTTASGTFQCNVAAMQKVKVTVSANGGTIVVESQASSAVAKLKGGGGGGGGGAPTTATYIMQTANGGTSAEQALGALATGCLGSTTTTGVVASRTLTGTANQITVTNGDCSGNPTFSIPTNPTLPGTTTGTFSGNLTGTASIAATGDSATSFFSSGTIEDARLPSSMADKVFTGSILLPNGTAVPGTCSIGMLYFDNDATAGVNLYGCTASNTWTLLGDGGGGSGDVTAASTFGTDNVLIRSDGTSKGVQSTGISVSDTTNDITGAGSIGFGSNPGDAGRVRLSNGSGEGLCFEIATPGTDKCLILNTSDQLDFNGTINLSGTSTGSVVVNGSTSGSLTITTNNSTAQAITVTGAAQTTGATTLTIPDQGGTSRNFVFDTLTQTLTNKTLTAPVISTISNTGTITLPTATDTLVGKATTDTFTNKTYDAEGTGNVLTIPRRIWFPGAGCNNATAGSVWDLPTSNPAVPACVTGTNTQKGVLDFADGANALSAQLTYKLPSTWTGTVDANIKWFSATTTGDVVWQLATICVADAETDDPAFNTASTVTDTAKGTTNQTNDAAITTVTVTGCAAGELMHIKIIRDPAHASDTHAATARLVGVELVIREAI